MSQGRRLIAESLRRIAAGRPERDPKQWAYDLKAREEAGEPLSSVQRDMWRSALRLDLVTTTEGASA